MHACANPYAYAYAIISPKLYYPVCDLIYVDL